MALRYLILLAAIVAFSGVSEARAGAQVVGVGSSAQCNPGPQTLGQESTTQIKSTLRALWQRAPKTGVFSSFNCSTSSGRELRAENVFGKVPDNIFEYRYLYTKFTIKGSHQSYEAQATFDQPVEDKRLGEVTYSHNFDSRDAAPEFHLRLKTTGSNAHALGTLKMAGSSGELAADCAYTAVEELAPPQYEPAAAFFKMR